jgi:hypothetical protein
MCRNHLNIIAESSIYEVTLIIKGQGMSYIIVFFYVISASIIALGMIGNIIDEKEYIQFKKSQA